MRFRIVNHAYTVVGSCDDRDVATGPGQSYGPTIIARDTRLDGFSRAASTCSTPTRLRIAESGGRLWVAATAETGANSTANAIANAKATAKSSLLVSYSWFDRVLALFRWLRPTVAMQVVLRLDAAVNDGPCTAGFTVFIKNGPGGANPVPGWQGLYAISRNAIDPAKLDVIKPSGLVETISNPGQLADWPDGPPITVLPGRYDLTFEVSSVASADGTVSVQHESELFLYKL